MYDMDLKGKKFWRVLRCSCDEQEKESFPQQRMTTDSCAERFGVTISDEHPLPGLSATSGQQVEPLLKLIARKIDGEDFDGFILDSYSRFARSEADEARLYAECRDANLLILTDKEGLMMGAGAWAKRGAATDQNEGYARDVGRHISRKMIELVSKGLVPPTLTFPWGLDREYYDADGDAVFRVRRLVDGRRAVLDPEPPYAVRFYIAARQTRLDLRDDGYSFKWVPGPDELQVEAKEMFRQHYVHGVTYRRIAADFNKRGVRSMRGKLWSPESVQQVLRNPIWIGLSVGFTTASGVHCERTKTGVKMFPVPVRPGYRKDKKRRKRIAVRPKAAIEWVIAKQPKLESFLDQDVREIVTARWQAFLDNGGRYEAPSRKPRNLSPTSRYFLSQLLLADRPKTMSITAMSDDREMVGTHGPTRNGPPHRYYLSRREHHYPVAGAPKERVRADLVENEVIAALGIVLDQFELSAPKIAHFIDEKKRQMGGRPDTTKGLAEEKRSLEEWYRTAFSTRSPRGQQLLHSEAQRVERRLEEIDLRIAENDSASPDFSRLKTAEVIASVRHQFRNAHANLSTASPESLRALCAIFCSTLTFNALSRELKIEFALPSWAITTSPRIEARVGTGETSGSAYLNRTNGELIKLAAFRCKERRPGGRWTEPCLSCKRSKAA